MSDACSPEQGPGRSAQDGGAVRADLLSVLGLVVALLLLVGLSVLNQPDPSTATSERVPSSQQTGQTKQGDDRGRNDGAGRGRGQDGRADGTEPRRPAQQRPVPEGPALGPRGAPVVLQVFDRYRCEACSIIAQEVLPALQRQFVQPGKLRIEWHAFPGEKRSTWVAARASWAAAQQGVFWEFHALLHAEAQQLGGGSWDMDALTEAAATVGMNTAEFRRDLHSDQALRAVQRDVVRARRLGVDRAPTLVVDGRAFEGAVSFERLQRVIERALEKTSDRGGGSGR